MSSTTLPEQLQQIVQESIQALRTHFSEEMLAQMEEKHLIQEIESTLLSFVGGEMNATLKQAAIYEIESQLVGFGIVEKLLSDQSITDIMINGIDHIFVEHRGKLRESTLRFSHEEELYRVINRMLRWAGREIDPDFPMIDLALPNRARVNIILPPLSTKGPIISIRRLGGKVTSVQDLVNAGTLPPELLDFFKLAVRGRLNILIAGGTGAGKSTLLNVLSSFIPEEERVVTIEDAAELKLTQRHVISLETKTGVGDVGEVTCRDLFKNCLRMRPDRIIVGEVRGVEVLDMLQAMNTGHEGSMTTLHANSPRDALIRLESLIRMAGIEPSETALTQSISRAFHLVVQVTRLSDGRRVVKSVQEITGRESNVITMQELFVFQQQGIDTKGRVIGQFRATGVRPKFYERIQRTVRKGSS